MKNKILFFLGALSLAIGFGLAALLTHLMSWHGASVILTTSSLFFFACSLLGLAGKTVWIDRVLDHLS